MMVQRWAHATACLLAVFAACGAATALAQSDGPADPAAAPGVEAVTSPSIDVTLSFLRAGRIARVLVKEGDMVAAGQVLAELDDESEQLYLAQLKAQAEDTTKVRAAEAQVAQKKVDAAKWEEVYKKGGATQFERDHAQLEALIGEMSLALARFEHEQDRRKYAEALVQVERMRLKSPIAGKVEQLAAKVGESAEAMTKLIRVVQTDPLWIDAPVPVAQATGIRTSSEAVVAFDAPGGGATPPPTVTGRVIHVASVADAASSTIRVRVEVPNPTSRPAGERVFVSFPSTKEEAGNQQPSAVTVTEESNEKKEQ